jgi:hypothetical protein
MAGGWITARFRGRSWRVPPIRFSWLVILAFALQFFAVYLPASRLESPDELAAAGIVASQILLLFFCWINRLVSCRTACSCLSCSLTKRPSVPGMCGLH